MARRKRRRPPRPDSEPTAELPSPIVRFSFPDEDTMRLRTFWAPGPIWAPGFITGVIGAVIALLVWSGGDTFTGLIIGGGVGYFGGGIAWAILGAVGGDVLEIDFDLSGDVGRVQQALLWSYRRQWQFELYDLEGIEIRERRGRAILLQFGSVHTAHLQFADAAEIPDLRVARVHTDREIAAIGNAISDFLGVPLRNAA